VGTRTSAPSAASQGATFSSAWISLAGQSNDRPLPRSGRDADLDGHRSIESRKRQGAATARVSRLQAQSDLDIDVIPGDAEASRAPAATGESLEEVAEILAGLSPGIRACRLPAGRGPEVRSSFALRA
jgi:hypothetical protein